MVKFLLYRSGIHDATIFFREDGVYFQKRSWITYEWGTVRENRIQEAAAQVLTEKKAKEFEEKYHIHPLLIWERYSEYRKMIKSEQGAVKTSWGAVYEKADHSMLFCGLPSRTTMTGKDTPQHQAALWVERQKKYPIDVVAVQGKPVAFVSPSRENCSVLVEEGMEKWTPVALWDDEKISPPRYAAEHLGTFMVAMRDGARLATDVWLPQKRTNPVPVIFVRTPYGRLSYVWQYATFIQRGYGLVIQDTRGRHDSEGEWLPKFYEREDGDDTLNWIAAQHWCDGNIGMIGASYSGYVQWAAAASGNPHLKALVSIVTAGSPFIDIPRKGGAFVSGMLAWTFAMAEKQFRPDNMERDDWDEVLRHRPIKDIPKKALGKEIPFWNEWMRHSRYDDFWKKTDWSRYKEKMKVPAMIISGWFDDNGMGTTEALEMVAEFAAEDRKIILGPWMHQANTVRDLQGVGLGNHALRYDLDVLIQKWFDKKLKKITHDMGPAAEYYVLGENRWHQATHWPPEDAGRFKWYLGSGSALMERPAEEEGYKEYGYDPENPAPHLIDVSENEMGVPANYKEVEQREDVLVFTSAPFAEPVTIAGDMIVSFYASSSARDTDWVVRITDVDPEGNSMKLADGVLRARFREGFDKEVLLEPGKVEKYEIRTSKFANTFQPGHRIRLTITSSAENFIFPNSNTGNDPAADIETVPAVQRIYFGGRYPSKIVFGADQ